MDLRRSSILMRIFNKGAIFSKLISRTIIKIRSFNPYFAPHGFVTDWVKPNKYIFIKKTNMNRHFQIER